MNTKNVAYEFYPLGENGVVIQFGNEISPQTYHLVRTLSNYLESHRFLSFLEHVPAFTTVTVYYDSLFFLKKGIPLPYEKVCQELEAILAVANHKQNKAERMIEIPVCYGGEFGPDLQVVAEHNHLTVEEIISIHSNGDYFVYMIGFAPGFPYIGGMSKQIFAPRKSSPRMNISAGSVGIAGNQTGIYPLETPGGWQIIGRTPLKLFRPNEEIPSFLKAGDRIRFVPISSKEYFLIKGGGRN